MFSPSSKNVTCGGRPPARKARIKKRPRPLAGILPAKGRSLVKMLRGTTRFPPRQNRLRRRSNASNGGKPSRTTGHHCRSRGPLGSELPALLHPGTLSAGEAPLWYCAYSVYFLRRCVLRIQVCNKAYVTTLRHGFQAGIYYLMGGAGEKKSFLWVFQAAAASQRKCFGTKSRP